MFYWDPIALISDYCQRLQRIIFTFWVLDMDKTCKCLFLPLLMRRNGGKCQIIQKSISKPVFASIHQTVNSKNDYNSRFRASLKWHYFTLFRITLINPCLYLGLFLKSHIKTVMAGICSFVPLAGMQTSCLQFGLRSLWDGPEVNIHTPPLHLLRPVGNSWMLWSILFLPSTHLHSLPLFFFPILFPFVNNEITWRTSPSWKQADMFLRWIFWIFSGDQLGSWRQGVWARRCAAWRERLVILIIACGCRIWDSCNPEVQPISITCLIHLTRALHLYDWGS